MGEYFPKETAKAQALADETQRNDIKLVLRRIRHVGTDKLRIVMQKFEDLFVKNKVEMIFETKITDLIIKKDICTGVIDSKGKKYFAKKILLAPGRVGALWLQDLSKKYKIPYTYDMVEIGVRVEFPAPIMAKFADILYESIFEIRTLPFDDIIRTFCPCPHGKVAIEKYQGYVCVNGHSNSLYDSVNSNFAFVSEVGLTEPVENTTIYAQRIAELTTTLGGGKPIIQRLADLKTGRRSTWGRIEKSFIEPTLKDATPGDISMAMPYRIVSNILYGLKKLNSVLPGIDSGSSTLLYAPEVKYRGSKIMTKNNLETNIKNLFVAGDGAGISGNIIGAAVTGIMAGRGMK